MLSARCWHCPARSAPTRPVPSRPSSPARPVRSRPPALPSRAPLQPGPGGGVASAPPLPIAFPGGRVMAEPRPQSTRSGRSQRGRKRRSAMWAGVESYPFVLRRDHAHRAGGRVWAAPPLGGAAGPGGPTRNHVARPRLECRDAPLSAALLGLSAAVAAAAPSGAVGSCGGDRAAPPGVGMCFSLLPCPAQGTEWGEGHEDGVSGTQ